LVPSVGTKRGSKWRMLSLSVIDVWFWVWVSHLFRSHQFSGCIPISFPFSHIFNFHSTACFHLKELHFWRFGFSKYFYFFSSYKFYSKLLKHVWWNWEFGMSLDLMLYPFTNPILLSIFVPEILKISELSCPFNLGLG